MNATHRFGILAVTLLGALATAGAVKTWTTGEYITSADINANFAHIHNTMVGGHGPKLVNSDVASGAALSHAKLATPALVPKAWVSLAVTCTVGTCVDVDKSVVTSVAYVSPGVYTVNYPTRGTINYGTLVTTFGNSLVNCTVTARTTTTATVTCVTGTTGAVANGAFTFMLLDSET